MLTPRTVNDKRKIIRLRSCSFANDRTLNSIDNALGNALISPKGFIFNNQYGTLNRSFNYNSIIDTNRSGTSKPRWTNPGGFPL